METASILGVFLPPVCVACRAPCRDAARLCADCVHELNSEPPVWGDPPPGASQAVSCFRHEGAARNLIRAYKFGRMPGLAPLMAGYMAEHVDGGIGRTVVAVPPSPIRQRLRGFDPAGRLAHEVCSSSCLPPPASGVIVRSGSARQRGRGREARLAAPPLIRSVGTLEGPVLLVDDVITTGATITACAAALERCGAGPVMAMSFTRRV